MMGDTHRDKYDGRNQCGGGEQRCGPSHFQHRMFAEIGDHSDRKCDDQELFLLQPARYCQDPHLLHRFTFAL